MKWRRRSAHRRAYRRKPIFRIGLNRNTRLPSVRGTLRLALLEGFALHNRHHEREEAILIATDCGADVVQSALVVRLDAAAQRVGEHLLGEAATEFAGAHGLEDLPQLARAVERLPARQRAG